MAKKPKRKIAPVEIPFADRAGYDSMITGLESVNVNIPGGVQVLPPTPLVNHGGIVAPDDNNLYDIRGKKKPG